MPKPKQNKKAWEIEFQQKVIEVAPRCGLTVSRSKVGNIELRHRKKGLNEIKTLPFKWQKDWGDAYTRIRNIYVFLSQGHSLKSAADLAKGKAPKKAKDWTHIFKSFEHQKLNFGKSVTQATFNKDYSPALKMVIDLMNQRNPPANPKDLIDLCVKDWMPGSRTREIRARAIKQFLTHAIDREGVADIWKPPENLKTHIGQAKPKEIINREGDHFEDDQQILNFLATLPVDSEIPSDADAAKRWINAFQLMAELGLRPIEVGYLKVKKDPVTKKLYWWCDYRKKSGGGTTNPRKINPLPLVGDNGPQDWNLIERFKTGLLPLPAKVNGDSCNTYLKRRESWVSLKKLMKETQGLNIVGYSFRHSYSLRGHVLGIDSGSVAESMGHGLDSHIKAYPWASAATTDKAFEEARERQKTHWANLHAKRNKTAKAA